MLKTVDVRFFFPAISTIWFENTKNPPIWAFYLWGPWVSRHCLHVSTASKWPTTPRDAAVRWCAGLRGTMDLNWKLRPGVKFWVKISEDLVHFWMKIWCILIMKNKVCYYQKAGRCGRWLIIGRSSEKRSTYKNIEVLVWNDTTWMPHDVPGDILWTILADMIQQYGWDALFQ